LRTVLFACLGLLIYRSSLLTVGPYLTYALIHSVRRTECIRHLALQLVVGLIVAIALQCDPQSFL